MNGIFENALKLVKTIRNFVGSKFDIHTNRPKIENKLCFFP